MGKIQRSQAVAEGIQIVQIGTGSLLLCGRKRNDGKPDGAQDHSLPEWMRYEVRRPLRTGGKAA